MFYLYRNVWHVCKRNIPFYHWQNLNEWAVLSHFNWRIHMEIYFYWRWRWWEHYSLSLRWDPSVFVVYLPSFCIFFWITKFLPSTPHSLQRQAENSMHLGFTKNAQHIIDAGRYSYLQAHAWRWNWRNCNELNSNCLYLYIYIRNVHTNCRLM